VLAAQQHADALIAALLASRGQPVESAARRQYLDDAHAVARAAVSAVNGTAGPPAAAIAVLEELGAQYQNRQRSLKDIAAETGVPVEVLAASWRARRSLSVVISVFSRLIWASRGSGASPAWQMAASLASNSSRSAA
jgi:hypothetical protein